MDATELALALQLCRGIGSNTTTRALMRNQLLGYKAEGFCELNEATLVEEFKFTKTAANNWVANRTQLVSKAKELKSDLAKRGVRVASTMDALYPYSLEKFLDSPPALLFLYGNMRLLNTKTFAVMSSRKSPMAYLEQIEKLAEEGIEHSEVLVAGHDTKEYQRAAIVPLRWGSPRILVLDMGMFAALGENLDDEPFRTARLWRYKFDPQTDLVVSAINPVWTTHPAANSKRDGLIAGLAQRIDFAQVREGGNMDQLLQRALEVGKPVRVSDLNLQASEYRRKGAALIA
ncbi:MAG: DNA-processing protein DprA [Chthonomonas sp.]|nr:DNA-processing protein DprA [Chthonomonas sp.]